MDGIFKYQVELELAKNKRKNSNLVSMSDVQSVTNLLPEAHREIATKWALKSLNNHIDYGKILITTTKFEFKSDVSVQNKRCAHVLSLDNTKTLCTFPAEPIGIILDDSTATPPIQRFLWADKVISCDNKIKEKIFSKATQQEKVLLEGLEQLPIDILCDLFIGAALCLLELDTVIEMSLSPTTMEVFCFNMADRVWKIDTLPIPGSQEKAIEGINNVMNYIYSGKEIDPKSLEGMNMYKQNIFTGEKKLMKERKCAACQKENENSMICSRCKKVRYCGVECQKKDWPEHKRVCISQ